MKNLCLFSFFIFLMLLIGCSDKVKRDQKNIGENPASNISKNVSIKKSVNATKKSEAAFEEKIRKGEIILLTKTAMPNIFNFGTSSKIFGIKMPDRNIYQVRQDGDKVFMHVPEKGEMELIKLNGKYYLFDKDNQSYEVKLRDGKLIAEAKDLTDVLVAMNK
ncbi:MAG TPA: hypothetical protein VMT35_11515 [Ignavibacteriaceae bacterium]|nr:hypothetical protein [Ignavibacteriaceae bacterium]